MPLGAAAGGLLLAHATPTVVIGVSAVTCMLAGATALCLPALHRLRTRRAGPVDSRRGRDDPCRALVRPALFPVKHGSGVAKEGIRCESGAAPQR